MEAKDWIPKDWIGVSELDRKEGEERKIKDTKVKVCERQLMEMGFKRGESEAVSAGVEGDLEKAIDILEEDRAAWEGRKAGNAETYDWHNRGPFNAPGMPGGWGSWGNF